MITDEPFYPEEFDIQLNKYQQRVTEEKIQEHINQLEMIDKTSQPLNKNVLDTPAFWKILEYIDEAGLDSQKKGFLEEKLNLALLVCPKDMHHHNILYRSLVASAINCEELDYAGQLISESFDQGLDFIRDFNFLTSLMQLFSYHQHIWYLEQTYLCLLSLLTDEEETAILKAEQIAEIEGEINEAEEELTHLHPRKKFIESQTEEKLVCLKEKLAEKKVSAMLEMQKDKSPNRFSALKEIEKTFEQEIEQAALQGREQLSKIEEEENELRFHLSQLNVSKYQNEEKIKITDLENNENDQEWDTLTDEKRIERFKQNALKKNDEKGKITAHPTVEAIQKIHNTAIKAMSQFRRMTDKAYLIYQTLRDYENGRFVNYQTYAYTLVALCRHNYTNDKSRALRLLESAIGSLNKHDLIRFGDELDKETEGRPSLRAEIRELRREAMDNRERASFKMVDSDSDLEPQPENLSLSRLLLDRLQEEQENSSEASEEEETDLELTAEEKEDTPAFPLSPLLEQEPVLTNWEDCYARMFQPPSSKPGYIPLPMLRDKQCDSYRPS